MSDDAIYRYFGKNPSYVGGNDESTSTQPHAHGGEITVLPCGVITFSGSFDARTANYIGFVSGIDNELADEIAALMDTSEDVDVDTITDIVNSGVYVIGGDDEFSDSDRDSEGYKHVYPHDDTRERDELSLGLHEIMNEAIDDQSPFDITMF